jgi:hypothetical protein
MPPLGILTVHSSLQVMLVHLAANAIPLGLGIIRQEISQLLVDFGDCLVMSLLEFLEHLLGLLNIHLAGLNVTVGDVMSGGFLIVLQSIEIRRGFFPGAITLMYFSRLKMLVSIFLIGGNYGWCFGWSSRQSADLPRFLLQQKMVCTQKFVGSFFGGANVVLTYLFN